MEALVPGVPAGGQAVLHEDGPLSAFTDQANASPGLEHHIPETVRKIRKSRVTLGLDTSQQGWRT